VLIVTLDTTRADRLPSYGFTGVVTPALSRLSYEGVVFEQAVSVAPLTLPAHCSLFTGLLPPHHHVRDNLARPLDEDWLTLAEVLRAKGFRTAAFVGSAVLGRDRGLAQGFDEYVDGRPLAIDAQLRRSGAAVVDDAVRWLEHRDEQPFLAWVHLYDAHAPYILPQPYRAMYADDEYVGAIAFMDAQIGRLLDVLDHAGLADRTLLVIAADHGESLGDHGEQSHGILLYESTLHVPLIIRAPRFPARRVSSLVRLVDVMPTVLDLAGAPATSSDGSSLVSLLSGRRGDLALEAYSESWYPRRFGWSPLRALRSDRFKLIDGPRPELYDLASDPFEAHDIIATRRGLATAMARRLSRLAGDPRGTVPNPEILRRVGDERLSSLGYVARGSVEPVVPSPSQPPLNPKDHIAEYNRIVRERTHPGSR